MDFIFYLTLSLFILLFGLIDCNIDYDFWARLIVGKNFFQTGELFNFDFQSYGITHKFIDHEWGSSLIFYLIQNNFGDIGLFVFKSLIIFLTVFVITKIIRLDNKNSKLHFLFFFFCLHSISYNIFSNIRCQTFSFLFFVLYLYILKYAKNKNNYRVLWCLPVLNIIWANCHGGFSIGLVLIFLFAVGEFLNKEKYKPYFYCFFISLFTSLINPYGIEYIYYIFNALSLNRIHITEWQSAFFNENFKYFLIKFKIFFAITNLLFIYSIFKNIKSKNFYKNIDKTKYLILLFTLIISLKSLRFHVFFTYSVMALCYNDFYNIFNKKLPEIYDNLKETIIFILILISTISHFQNKNYLISTPDYPIYCIEFIKQNSIKGNLFINFHYGSYASYKLYPNNQIFMDGRYEEVYDNSLINEMAGVFLAKNQDEFFKKYHTDILILDKSYPIVEKMKKNNDWFLAYEDEKFSLFLNKKYKNKKFKTPTKDLNYYNKTKFNTLIDWVN